MNGRAALTPAPPRAARAASPSSPLILAAQFGVFEAALRVWGTRKRRRRSRACSTTTRRPATGSSRTRGSASRPPSSTPTSRINGAGVRDDETIGPKAPDERRIVLLGDSLVLSVQVPFAQTFGELLERRLNARAGRRTATG